MSSRLSAFVAGFRSNKVGQTGLFRMNAHLYTSPSGRVIAVDDCDQARAKLPELTLPEPMFFGRSVPPEVVEQCLRECGGLWFRATGLRRVRPPAAPAV